MALLLKELDNYAQVDVLAHPLHKVLISNDEELFEGHTFFDIGNLLALTVRRSLQLLVHLGLDLENLLNGEEP
jgi:hypothetical protein